MRSPLSTAFCVGSLLLTQFVVSAPPVRAAEIHVNNHIGDDLSDGRAAEPVNRFTGPVRTIGRAVRLAGQGDVIVIANTGSVYLEAVQLDGARHSGLGTLPLTILGNGAVVDGSAPVPPASWRRIRGNLWSVTPLRKGHYQLLLGDRPLPEFRIPESAAVLPDIPAGEWGEWRGSIYFHVPDRADPSLLPVRMAVQGVGLSLYAVRNVLVRDLTFRFFRLDGVNAHDLCRGVVLENVRCIGNGRAGATAAGSSEIVLRNCELRGNQRHSLLVTETAEAEVLDSQLGQPPTVVE